MVGPSPRVPVGAPRSRHTPLQWASSDGRSSPVSLAHAGPAGKRILRLGDRAHQRSGASGARQGPGLGACPARGGAPSKRHSVLKRGPKSSPRGVGVGGQVVGLYFLHRSAPILTTRAARRRLSPVATCSAPRIPAPIPHHAIAIHNNWRGALAIRCQRMPSQAARMPERPPATPPQRRQAHPGPSAEGASAAYRICLQDRSFGLICP